MALPISILWSIRVGFGQKLLLAGLFSLVMITIAFAIVRVTVLSTGYTTSHHQAEISWLCFMSFMESSVGKCIPSSSALEEMLRYSAMIVACLASFRALFTQKNRESEAKEAKKREINSKGRAMWARAKYFQQSLLESRHTEGLAGMTQGTNDPVPLKYVSLSEHGLLNESHSPKTVCSHSVTPRTATSTESTIDWV
jgi:hypothetical protein